MANEAPVRFVDDSYLQSGATSFRGDCVVGKTSGDTDNGALRFSSVDIGQNPSLSLCLLVYVYSSTGDTSGNWKFKAYGIDEDNTADFSVNPLGRAKTSAALTIDEGPPTGGGTKTMDVTSLVTEICSRGGWARNNALGFILEDNGSSSNVYAHCDEAASYLVYRETAEPNFLPTPITVNAPTFPAADNYGMKISMPGIDVKTATDAQLLYTSRKDMLKIQTQNSVAVTAGVETLIAHGLGYKPQCICFVRKNGFSFELPRLFDGATDPVGGGVQGFYTVDSTYLRLNTTFDADVYYYITLEELS